MSILRRLFAKLGPTRAADVDADSGANEPVSDVNANAMASATNVSTSRGLNLTRYFAAVYSIPQLIECMDDYDGYVRQAAVKRSAALAHPELLPALVDRLNDWVPQVRDAARSAILTLLPQVSVSDVVGQLPAILNLRSAGRYDHTTWLAQFEATLLRSAHVDDLLAGVYGDHGKIARACFDILQRSEDVDMTALVLRAVSSRSNIAMARQAAGMIARLPPEARDSAYAAAMQSNFGPVKVFAVRATLREHPAEAARTLAISMLLDPQSSVREAAIAHLLSNAFEIGAYYRNLLDQASDHAATIRFSLAALGNLRQASDLEVIRKYCSHPLPSVRLQAYASWFRIAPADKDVVAQEAVLDAARRVTRAALDMVVKHGAYIPFDLVCATLSAPEDRDLLLSFARRSGQSVP
jgi:HEAT repeat protein